MSYYIFSFQKTSTLQSETGNKETQQNDTANTGNNGQNHSAQQNLEKGDSQDKLILHRQKHTLQQRE